MSVALLLDQAFRLQNQGEFAQAEKIYRKALKSVRDNPALWFNHGLVLRDLGQPQDALASFDQARRFSPPRTEIENERANALRELGRYSEALAALERALALQPLNVGALINRGLVLKALGRSQEALTDFDAVLRLQPRLALALVNRGMALEDLQRPAEALAAYHQALALDPTDCTTLNQAGDLLARSGGPQEALPYFDRALAHDPGHAVVRFSRAMALLALKRVDEAHAQMQQLFAEHPDNPFVFDGLLETSLRTCDFALRETLEKELPAHVRAKWLLTPLRLFWFSGDPALQRAAATTYLKSRIGRHVALMPPRRVASGRRLKLAYLSYDFGNHPVATCSATLLEQHDRNRFELFGVSTGHDDASPMRARLRGAFEHFLDVRDQGDEAVARLLAAAEIDILVDLGGHTAGARPGIAGRRPAPVQVNYLGWAATTGSSFIDYMIGDAIVAPPGSDGDFTEKLVRLPNCFMTTDTARDSTGAPLTRAQAGLPETGFVFYALHGVFKITPDIFRTWMALLRDVPGSVLWLRADNAIAERNLRQVAVAQGVAPERLVFAGFVNEAEHIARYRLADLFLDTTPFNGHSSAIEALWAGLPLVACSGSSFASRVSASALKAVGMPELATVSLADYQALALKLARDPALLPAYRDRLEKGRASLPLFDSTGLTRALEAAYEKMAERSRAGLAPAAFIVD
jgi:protein O-GlcNAc transferase